MSALLAGCFDWKHREGRNMMCDNPIGLIIRGGGG